MALGVEAAGLITATGDAVHDVRTGDRITTHSVPLRDQGSWAEQFIAPEGHMAALPPAVSFDAGAALPVPALTADQVLSDALNVQAGQTVLGKWCGRGHRRPDCPAGRPPRGHRAGHREPAARRTHPGPWVRRMSSTITCSWIAGPRRSAR